MEPLSDDSSSSSPSRSPSPDRENEPPSKSRNTSTPKTPNAKANARATKERFSKEDIEHILTWLENPPNFASIYGSSAKTGIGKPNKKATLGWKALAGFLCKQSKGRWKTLNDRAMKERFNRHKTVYMKVKQEAKDSGFGVKDEDRQNNVFTVKQKLEKMCMCYERMDALFGHRPNVTPLGSADVCVLQSSASQDEDNVLQLENQPEAQDGDGAVEGRSVDAFNDIQGDRDEAGNYDDNQDFGHDNDFNDNHFDHNHIDDNRINDIGIRTDERSDGDDASSFSLASSVVQRKRQISTDATRASSKRSRATDKRKRPSRVETDSSSSTPKNTFLSAFEKAFSKSEGKRRC